MGIYECDLLAQWVKMMFVGFENVSHAMESTLLDKGQFSDSNMVKLANLILLTVAQLAFNDTFLFSFCLCFFFRISYFNISSTNQRQMKDFV